MNYSLTWLPKVLRDFGLKVEEIDGWQSRGHGDVGRIKGVLCHHTAGSLKGNAPSLDIVTNGRPDLPGPLSQLVLGRDGTLYVVAAGLSYHAGRGSYRGVTSGNSSFIGIEAENTGLANDNPWPEIQMDAYAKGVAAILRHIGAPVIMAPGHMEYALPVGRKSDPSFSVGNREQRLLAMMAFRERVAKVVTAPIVETDRHTTLRYGSSGDAVKELQRKLGLKDDGEFGPMTEAAVKAFQVKSRIVADGIVGTQTQELLT